MTTYHIYDHEQDQIDYVYKDGILKTSKTVWNEGHQDKKVSSIELDWDTYKIKFRDKKIKLDILELYELYILLQCYLFENPHSCGDVTFYEIQE